MVLILKLSASEQCLRWKQEAELLQTRNLIVAEAHSFRGTSKLQCAILDCSTPGRQTLKTYHLPGILSNYRFEFMDREQFIAAAADRSIELPSWVGRCHFCFKVFELEQKRQRWWFTLPRDTLQQKQGRLTVLRGLTIWGDRSGNQVSARLSRTPLLCFMVP